MANGNGSLSNSWARFDQETKMDLVVNELDRVYARLDRHAIESAESHATLRREFLEAITAVKGDFNERMTALRLEVHEGFKEMEKRDTRKTALFYSLIGGVLVVLVTLVAQLASSQ